MPSSAAPSPTPSSSRRSTARSAASFWLPLTSRLAMAIGDSPRLCFAAAPARSDSSTLGMRAATSSTWSICARTSSAEAPSRRATTTARVSRWAPSKSASASSTAAEPEPGTVKPPAVRFSVCLAAKGSGGDQEHDPERDHQLAAALEERGEPVHSCLHRSPLVLLPDWPASQSRPDRGPPVCDTHHRALSRRAAGARCARRARARRSCPRRDPRTAAARRRRRARRSPRPRPRGRRRA